MITATPAEIQPRLHRVLGTRDLVLLNVAAIVGLRWLSTAAQIGPLSLGLMGARTCRLFVPLALAVIELSSRMPGEGGPGARRIWDAASKIGEHANFSYVRVW